MLRLKNKTRVLWIDQICIDQASHSDRSHSVKQMADIYEKCASVLVWTGELDKESIDLLSRMAYPSLEQHPAEECDSNDSIMLDDGPREYKLNAGDGP